MKKLIFSLLFLALAIFIFTPKRSARAFSNNPINAAIQIVCISNKFDVMKGSGVIVSPDGRIITNAHVVGADPYKLWSCFGGMITKEDSYKPDSFFNISFFYKNITNDLAFGIIDKNLDGQEGYLTYSDTLSSYPYLKLNFKTSIGEDIKAFGYPRIAEDNLNITKGYITSKPIVGDYKYLFSNIEVSYGNSGGAIVDENNKLVGLATAVNSSDISKNTYILDVNSLYIEKDWLNKVKNANKDSKHFIDSWTNGLDFIENILNLNDKDSEKTNNIEHVNYGSTLSTHDLDCKAKYGKGSRYYKPENSNEIAGCYCINDYKWNSDKTNCIFLKTEDKGFLEKERGLTSSIDKNLSYKLSGRILLQVENNGEGWYINPDNKKRHYLGRPNDAFNIMRDFGLGISNKDFNSFKGVAPKRLSGKILLKVEDSGKAYYVNPVDLKMYFLGRPSDAFEVMRNLGLGISNNDIRKIDTN